MSAYITLTTPMLDEDCLVAAIVDQGFAAADIVRSASPIVLRGWQQGRSANVVLRKEQTGDHYNDIGFLRGPMGFTAILSDDDKRFGSEWLSRVSARYEVHLRTKHEQLATKERERLEEERRALVETQRQAVHERAREMGYRIEEKREGDTIRLVLTKRTYG